MKQRFIKILKGLSSQKKVDTEIIFSPTTVKHFGKEAKFVLIIYVSWAIKAWVNKQYKDENFNSHSMHWESIEMVKLLNAKGYNVEVVDCTKSLPEINWLKYAIIFDERNNIYTSPIVTGQKKVCYATGCHWLTQNLGELNRIQSFKNRHGIVMPSLRQVEPILSEATADVTTYFGGNFQKNSFTNPSKTFLLFQTTTYNPIFKEKDYDKCRNNFLWLGSRGLIHKGLDIVLEVFKLKKDFNLHICANIELEPEFYNWFSKEFCNCSNIIYHGWKKIHEISFHEIAYNCIGTINCSVTEGGAGATIQAMQFGCIPIVNEVVDDATYLKGKLTGFRLMGDEPLELMDELASFLNGFHSISNNELQERSQRSREYASTYHSRDAYSQRFSKLINFLENE